MTELMLAGDEDSLATHGLIRQVYDSCCGTGGMLTIAKEHINSINPEVHVELSGQELNPKNLRHCQIRYVDGGSIWKRSRQHSAW